MLEGKFFSYGLSCIHFIYWCNSKCGYTWFCVKGYLEFFSDLELPWVIKLIIQFGAFLDESGHVFILAVVGVLILSIFFFLYLNRVNLLINM